MLLRLPLVLRAPPACRVGLRRQLAAPACACADAQRARCQCSSCLCLCCLGAAAVARLADRPAPTTNPSEPLLAAARAAAAAADSGRRAGCGRHAIGRARGWWRLGGARVAGRQIPGTAAACAARAAAGACGACDSGSASGAWPASPRPPSTHSQRARHGSARRWPTGARVEEQVVGRQPASLQAAPWRVPRLPVRRRPHGSAGGAAFGAAGVGRMLRL